MSLEIKQLNASRDDATLFSDVSFQLNAGEALHIAGANGSGKTTLLRAICGLFCSESGEILWKDESIFSDLSDYYKNVLYLGHKNGIKSDLTAFENLQLMAELSSYSVTEENILDALSLMGVASKCDVLCGKLSQGQKRRVALANMILKPAKLWVLDEPFVALDVDAVKTLLEVIEKHLDAGGMLVITTHQKMEFSNSKVKSIQTLDLGEYVFDEVVLYEESSS